ncbi:MAG: flagellar hook-associated family protein [Caulobacteraceae bacterium]|nr:flagellar hook-associated family protein [Caulobacteraceae bacterium]
MSATYVSSQYLANALVAPVNQAQSALATATAEMSSGEYSDLGLQLGDQSGYELSLKNELAQIQALTASNSVIATNLSTAQDALTSVSDAAAAAAKDLVSWTPAANSGPTLQTIGQTALQSLIASANATSGGTYVFGGINSSAAPLADYFATTTSAAKSAVDAAFQSAFGVAPTDPAAASIPASAIQNFLSGSFATLFSGSAWTSNWSQASSANTSATIAPGQTAATSANANDPTFQQLAEAYTMLSEFGGSQLSASAQQAVASAAQSLVAKGQTSLINLQASVGLSQSAVSSANASMSSQSTLLQTQIGGLDNVDQNALAARITSLQTQIQMAYELTARLQTLSLANYLPAP